MTMIQPDLERTVHLNNTIPNQWRLAIVTALAIASSGRTTKPRVFKNGDSWCVSYYERWL